MCLYPKTITNRKYTINKKNSGNIPQLPIVGKDEYGFEKYDERVLKVQVPCGQCEECRKGKARQWQVRLSEELKITKYPYFVTFTFAPKQLKEVMLKSRLHECNALAEYALRHCLERYRKDHKKSLKHWMITELGHEGTERIHMHGLLLSDHELQFDKSKEDHFYTWKYWKYGMIYVGDYCTLQTINYIVKYVTKIDTDHKGFIGQVFASPGIGKEWINRIKASTFNWDQYILDHYRLSNGAKVKLPTYYKNHLYNEDQREENWRSFMDKEQTTIAGNTYIDKRDYKDYPNIINKAREENAFLGFGSDDKEWRKKNYNITKKMLQETKKRELWQKLQDSLAKRRAAGQVLKPEDEKLLEKYKI